MIITRAPRCAKTALHFEAGPLCGTGTPGESGKDTRCRAVELDRRRRPGASLFLVRNREEILAARADVDSNHVIGHDAMHSRGLINIQQLKNFVLVAMQV